MSSGDVVRYLRFRHPAGFSEARLGHFIAHYRCWRAYVEALIENWEDLPLTGGAPAPSYRIGEPRLAEDRRVISVELGGPWSVASRALIEDGLSGLLWRFFPLDFVLELEEGLAEPRRDGETSWRRALRSPEGRAEGEGGEDDEEDEEDEDSLPPRSG